MEIRVNKTCKASSKRDLAHGSCDMDKPSYACVTDVIRYGLHTRLNKRQNCKLANIRAMYLALICLFVCAFFYVASNLPIARMIFRTLGT